MTNCTSVVYVKNDTELSCMIELCVVRDENQSGQRHAQLYRFGLHLKQCYAVRTYRIGNGL